MLADRELDFVKVYASDLVNDLEEVLDMLTVFSCVADKLEETLAVYCVGESLAVLLQYPVTVALIEAELEAGGELDAFIVTERVSEDDGDDDSQEEPEKVDEELFALRAFVNDGVDVQLRLFDSVGEEVILTSPERDGPDELNETDCASETL